MKKHLFLFAFAVVTLASCKKEKSDNNNNDGDNNPGTTTKLLKKIIQINNGNTTVLNVLYNSAKKVIAVRSTDNTDVTTFDYDNGGNVTKVESIDGSEHMIYEYVYENGLPERATFKNYERTEAGTENLVQNDILHYTVEGGNVTKINMDMIEQQQEINFVLSYNNNGNLSKIQTDGSSAYVAEFTYGNKKPLFPKIFNFVLDQAGYSLHFFAKNDLLTQRYDFPGTDNDVQSNLQNTYDANGYVLTSDDGSTQLAFEY